MVRIKMTALALVSATALTGCLGQADTEEEDVDTQTSAVSIGGLILAKWNWLGGAAGVMGNVTTDELETAFGTGRYNFFQNGRILWKKGTPEAFSTYGNMDSTYVSFGVEWGKLGFPTKDEYLRGNGSPGTENNKEVNFEFGRLRKNGGLPWIVLTGNAADKLTTMNWPRITGGSMSALINGDGCLKNFTGAGFAPGKTVSVYINNPDFSAQMSGTATVRADGTFTIPNQTGVFCTPVAYIKRINNGVTFEARDTGGKRAASFVYTSAGNNFNGQI